MLTGLHPWEHGVRDNGLYRLSPDEPNAVRDLASAGYWCIAVVGAYPLMRQFGVAEGFHRFDDAIPSSLGDFQYPERGADVVTKKAAELLGEWDKKRPCFLWVHYFDPHAPYVRSHPIFSSYLAEISYMDAWIGRLIRALPGEHWSILVAGDHGEGLGEHDEKTHGDFLYASTLHIPLIGSGYGWKRGDVRLDPVSLVEIAATLRCLGGVRERSSCDAALLEPSHGRRLFSAETVHPLVRYGWSPLRAVQVGRWKLIVGERSELYDIHEDVLEQRDLATVFPETVATLTRLLPPWPEVGKLSKLTEQDRNALAALGYLPDQSASSVPRREILLLLEKANEFIHSRQWEEAQALFTDIVEKDPTNLRALIGLGTARVQTGDLAAADSVFRSVLSHHPRYVPALQNLAMVRFLMGDDDEAQILHQRVLELLPGDRTSLQTLAISLRRQGKYEESLARYQELIQVMPEDPRIYRDAGGLMAYELGRRAEGIELWNQALALDPGLPQADAMRREMRRWQSGRE
jgi:tetratricopeptide (TPR) repeat protein